VEQKKKSNQTARGTATCDNTTMHLLKANDFVAESIRREMTRRNILLINMTSSAGSGKTALPQETAKPIGDKVKMKVLVGDLETERDADRLRTAGVDALQIVTGGIGHLEPQMIWQGMENLDLEGVELLIAENVGNLVCPAFFYLGEDYRVTLIATTEGDDKPEKYPCMFRTGELLRVTIIDLLFYLSFSVDTAATDARDINPPLEVIEISSLQNSGVDLWCEWLLKRVQEKQQSKVSADIS